jgi:hypothetical protein
MNEIGDFLKKILPWIGAAATGNVPVLIGLAAKTVGDALGTEVAPKVDDIATAVAGATPEQLVSLREKENDFKERMQALGFQHIEEMTRLGLEETKAFVQDTQDARAKYSQNVSVFWLGVFILLTFAGIISLSLWGSYLLLSGGIQIKDVGIVAAVFGFLGTVIGYVAANAQQVVGFFYGSSKGSGDKTDAMAAAFAQLGKPTK